MLTHRSRGGASDGRRSAAGGRCGAGSAPERLSKLFVLLLIRPASPFLARLIPSPSARKKLKSGTPQAPRSPRSCHNRAQIVLTNVMATCVPFRAAPSGAQLTAAARPPRRALAARPAAPRSSSSRAAVVCSSSNGAGPVAVAAAEVRPPAMAQPGSGGSESE